MQEDNGRLVPGDEGVSTGTGETQAEPIRVRGSPRKFRFTGTAMEFFGIWISNLFLSIVTIGIYSAWAKVRRTTYFYNNTEIAGHSLDYHATGGQILKGRVIALLIILVMNVTISLQPLTGLVVFPIFFFLVPWVLNRSMKFAARMTSYRNVCFDWHGTYWKSFLFFVVGPILGLVSLGLLTPFFSKHYYQYFATHHSYGTSRFSAEPSVSSYYLAFLMGGVIPMAVISGILLAIVSSTLAFQIFSISEIYFGVVIGAFLFSMSFIYRVLCRNLMMRSLVLSEVARFGSTLNPVRYTWIALSNLVAVIITLGWLLPWAQVRMYRYLTHSSTIRITGDLNKFLDSERSSGAAFGEEFADFEGFDVSI